MKTCEECKQECCSNVIIEIDEPETIEDWDDIKWQVAHKNVRVIKDNDDDWCIEFLTTCDEMDENGKCKVYEKRPKMCRNHDSETCVVNGEGEYYKIEFNNIKDVEQYLLEHPDAIKEETVDLNTCPKCGYEWADEEEDDESTEEESESPISEPNNLPLNNKIPVGQNI